MRVLIVDDTELSRRLLRTILHDLGVESVHEASDAIAAFDQLMTGVQSRHPFQLLFLDINMPNVTGIELLKMIRSEPVLLKLPVILATAERDPKLLRLVKPFHVTGYLPKPFTPEMVEEKLKRVPGKKSA